MQKYQSKKSHLITLLTVLFTVFLISIAILIVKCVDLQKTSSKLTDIGATDIPDLSCSQYCFARTQELNGQCCLPGSQTCESKEICHDNVVKHFEAQIRNDVYGVTYSAGPALIFLLFLVLIATHFYRLRKAAKEELLFQEQEALLAHENAIHEIQYEFDDQSFQNYEEFIQFLIDSGYILPGMAVAPKKRGDPKISDSFGTADNEACPICMMELSGEKVLSLRCEHKFHSSCIRDWNQANPSCPVCRADIYPA